MRGATRHDRVSELFLRACDLEPRARRELLDRECEGDPALRMDVESLLDSDRRVTGMGAARVLGPVRDAASAVVGELEKYSPGDRLGAYRIVRHVDSGGMGDVYEAVQERPVRRTVALKLIKPGMDSREVIARFESERQALALMHHPGIATVHDAGTTAGGRPYFSMEFVSGAPITQHCDHERLELLDRVELLIQVCDAVQHAHQRGIIHRDLKPTNVLVHCTGVSVTPKIIDFGIAKAIREHPGEVTLTQAGMRLGTPSYMSPEQASPNGRQVDTRTDVYALGVLLYELLVGTPPLATGGNEPDRNDPPPRPSTRMRSGDAAAQEAARLRNTDPATLRRRLRGDLDWIALKALEANPDDRYGSPAELGADLRRHLTHEPVLAGPRSTAYIASKLIRRHRTGTAFLLGSASLITIFAVVVYAQLQVQRQERDKATRINAFLQELLASARPAEAGRDVTVLEVLDQSAGKVGGDLSDQPEVLADVLTTLGNTYAALGRYEQAIDHLRRSAAIREEMLGESHPRLAAGLHDLAAALIERNDFPAAKQAASRALVIRRAAFGERHEAVAASLHQLASLHLSAGELDIADRYANAALELRRELLESPHADLAASQHTLASVWLDQSRYAEAEESYRQVVKMRRTLLGERHPDFLRTLNDLGMALNRQGRRAEAAAVQREVVALKIEVFGADHPSTAETYANLAVVLMMSGQNLDEAEKLTLQALEIWQDNLGSDHLYCITGWNNVGFARHALGNLDGAADAYRRAIEIHDGLPDPHLRGVYTFQNFGILAHYRGQLERAEVLIQTALERSRNLYGPRQIETALVLQSLGSLLIDLGRPQEAESVLQESLAILESGASDHPMWVLARNTLARSMAALGKRDVAAEMFRSNRSALLNRPISVVPKRQALQRTAALLHRWGHAEEAAIYTRALDDIDARIRGAGRR